MIILLLSLLILSYTLTYIIKEISIKKSLVAEVNERSLHTTPMPHGGGIAIVFTWLSGITYLFFTNVIETPLYLALIFGLILSIVSYIDDLIDLSPKIRLLTQAVIAFLGLFTLGGFEQLNFFYFTIENQFMTNIFAFLMIIWFINLYNFLDGIDGYAGSEAVFLSLAAFIFFGGAHFLVLAVSVLGFLVWNWHRAKIFMGDVSSTLLGYNVAIFTIYYGNQESSNFWVWIILFSLFWFDATLTLFRRYKNSEKVSQAHKKHAYQRLHQSGWSHSDIVIASIKLNILLFLIVYFFSSILLAFLSSLIILSASMKYIDSQKGFN